MLKKILGWFYQSQPAKKIEVQAPVVAPAGREPDCPEAFGYKCCWLAVPTTDTDRLASVFNLSDHSPCNWNHGISHAYEGLFFVSPPVDGWSFIVSRKLPAAENNGEIAVLRAILEKLSREFGEAQYFGTYRGVGYDCWMKAVNGQVQRAYAIVDGANTIVEGDLTPVEQPLNLINTFSTEAESDPDYFDKCDWPDESLTMEIAGAWGFNPQHLDGRGDLAPRLGLLGLWDRTLK